MATISGQSQTDSASKLEERTKLAESAPVSRVKTAEPDLVSTVSRIASTDPSQASKAATGCQSATTATRAVAAKETAKDPTKIAKCEAPTPTPSTTKPAAYGKVASLIDGGATVKAAMGTVNTTGTAAATSVAAVTGPQPKAGMTVAQQNAAIPKVSPTSAAAVLEEKVKTITAMDRLSAIGSVMASGPGAKAEPPKAAPASKAPSKVVTAVLPGAAPITGSVQIDASASAVSIPAPASVLKIVAGKPDPALESPALPAVGYPVAAATTGPARAYAATAAPKVAEVTQAEVHAGGKAAEVPGEGPAAVAVGRAVAAQALNPVEMDKGKARAPISKKYQVVFVTSEVAPYSKTGGLGEAMDGLPVAMAAFGHRVMVISPRYDQYSNAWDTNFWGSVAMGGKDEPVHFFHTYSQKVDLVFVDHPTFLERVEGLSGSKLYGPEWGKDFADNQARFAYFCKAALVAIKDLPLGGYPYGDKVVVVANDWHSALVPMFINVDREKDRANWANTKTALLCHNAVFQGRFPLEEGLAEVLGVPQAYVDKITFEMPLKIGKRNPKTACVNTMAAGLLYCDRVFTVSPTYALECSTDPEKGVELESLFAAGRVTGILNGVKEGVSPSDKNFVTKAMLSCGTFTPATVDAAKDELKAAYRKDSGLPASEGPLMCFIGRFDAQKGYDLLLEALFDVLEDTEMQVVIVGAGRADLVEQTKAMEKKFPNKLYYAGWMGPERYALLAGCDYTLLPSRWEPCGLVQMEAMRMGTLPIVAPTGGLKDTVADGVNGLWMDAEMTVEVELDDESVEAITKALRRASALHVRDPAKCSEMRKSAMAAAAEFTWSNAALQYEALFDELGVNDVLSLSSEKTVTLETDKQVC